MVITHYKQNVQFASNAGALKLELYGCLRRSWSVVTTIIWQSTTSAILLQTQDQHEVTFAQFT